MVNDIVLKQGGKCPKVFVNIITSIFMSLFIVSTVQAKLIDIVDIIMNGGGIDAVDTISTPVVADAKPMEVPQLQALKYNGGTKAIVTSVQCVDQKALPSTIEQDYHVKSKEIVKRQNDEDDDPLAVVISGISSSLSSSGRSGSHAATLSWPSFSWPSFNTTTAPEYTTDSSLLQSELNTPEVTLSYMNSNFSYSNHDGSTPYDPATFNSLRTGDCKDYATFFGWALADDGWEVHTIDYQYGSSSGHVISLYQGSDGQWYAQSNSSSIGPISSTEDAIAQTMPSGGTLGSYREFPQGYTGTYSWN